MISYNNRVINKWTMISHTLWSSPLFKSLNLKFLNKNKLEFG